MHYDFDTIRERRGTNCIKYDMASASKGRDDLLPLWVADMDFALPEEVVSRIRSAVDRGIFGYTFAGDDYFAAVQGWFAQRHGWTPEREWLVTTPGVVPALGMAVQALTDPGDAVLVQQPVYYPFSQMIEKNGRVLIDSELVYADGRYAIAFDDFERQIAENDVKLFILCSPHNPVGRVWGEDELRRLGQICLDHGVLVVSDEIHADLTFPGHRHSVFASIDEHFARNCIVCTAASKTFNLAGLQTSNVFIPNPEIRERFAAAKERLGIFDPNELGLVATRAAYEAGGPWHDQMVEYLQGNLDFARTYLRERIPQVKLVEPEGTYLLWLDCSQLGIPDGELDDFFLQKAHLWLDAGTMFGQHSAQFERMNIACPRATLRQALTQLEGAVAGL